jgi:hypothetical protein
MATSPSGDGSAAHEFAAIYACIAKQKEIPVYLGLRPDADYLSQVHRLPSSHLTPREQSRASRLDTMLLNTGPQTSASSDLRPLGNSKYQNQRIDSLPIVSDPKMFEYSASSSLKNNYIN